MLFRHKTIGIKVTLITMSIVIALFLGFYQKAEAAINPLINFAGKLTNLDGSEVADGVYDFSFGIYAGATGGAALWTENLTAANLFSADISGVTVNASSTTYDYNGDSNDSTLRVGQHVYNADTAEAALIIDFDNGANTVTVADGSPAWSAGQAINNRPYLEGGVIDINLGAVADLTTVDFNQPLYLEVIFNGETMQPRKNVAAMYQSFESARLGGKSESAFGSLSENEIVTGQWNFNNLVGMTASSASPVLTITQNGIGNIVEFKNGAALAFAVLGDGRVQIGNYYFPTTHGLPGYVLKTDINGNLSWSMDIVGAGGAGQWATGTNPTYGDFIYLSDTNLDLVVGNNDLTGPAGTRFEVEGLSWLDNVGISAQNQMQFYDADSSNYFALRATGTLASNFILTLPAGLGSSGQALLTNADGNLYWGTPSGFAYVNPGTAGQMPYFAADGSTLTGTSTIFLSTGGFVGIGTTVPSQLLTVGAGAGSQFLVNTLGQVVGGTWLGSAIGALYGGTGTSTAGWTGLPFITGGTWGATTTISALYGGTGFSSYAAGDLMFAGNATTLAKLPIGGTGNILVVSPAGLPSWVSTSSLNIDAGNMTGIVDTAHGGTGQNFSGSTGFIYLASGNAVASNTIAIVRTDLAASAGIVLTGNQLTLDTTGNWSGTFDNQEGSYYLNAVNLNNFIIPFAQALAGTTTTALAEGNNWYWTNVRFDNRLSATTSLPNINTLINLATVGTIATGTWQGSTLNVAWGGTGSTTLTANGLLYGNGTNPVRTTGQGPVGYILQSVGGVPTWVATSSLGIDFSDIGGIVPVAQGGTGADNAAQARINLGLAIGADVQAYDLGLNAIAGLATTSDLFIVANGTTWTTQDASTVRTTLGLAEAFNNRDYFINSAGTPGYVWSSDGSGAGIWLATSSLNIDLVNTTGMLAIARGGTNWNSTGVTGLAFINNGSWGSTSTVSIIYGGTGVTTLAMNGVLFGNGTGPILTTGQGVNGYILQSVNGVPTWVATTSLGIDFDSIGGVLPINQGGTGASTSAEARINLGLEDIYNFGINSTGTVGWLWQSDGNGRGQWVATNTLGIVAGNVYDTFIGTTTATTDGSISSSGLIGYQAANDMCDAEFAGSHFCRTHEILYSIQLDDITGWGNDITNAWIAEGPPGYTYDSNDCNGYVDNTGTKLGAFWLFNSNGGGAGWLVNCAQVKSLACCMVQ